MYISIFYYNGQTIKATIYGIDILPINRVLDKVIKKQSIKLYCNFDAYNYNFISTNLKIINF